MKKQTQTLFAIFGLLIFYNKIFAQNMDKNETFTFAISANPLALLMKQFPVAVDVRTGNFFSNIRYNWVGKLTSTSFLDGNLEDTNPANPKSERPNYNFTKGYQIGYTAKIPVTKNLTEVDDNSIYVYMGPEIMRTEIFFDNPNVKLLDIASNTEFISNFSGKATFNHTRLACGVIIGRKNNIFMDLGGTFGLRFRTMELTGKAINGQTQTLQNTSNFAISKKEFEAKTSGSYYGYIRVGFCF
jgi:hypothetical protein